MVARLPILIVTALVVAVLPAASSARLVARPGGADPRVHARPDGAERASQPGIVSQQTDGKKESSGEAKTGPMDVFDDIEQGWMSRNVDVILQHFGSQKVAISIEGNGPSGGSFSKSQSYYLLKDLFRFTSTKKFVFVQFRQNNEDRTESYAIAERHYRRTDDGRLIKDKVYVSLHLEREGDRERWVVDEIKSIR